MIELKRPFQPCIDSEHSRIPDTLKTDREEAQTSTPLHTFTLTYLSAVCNDDFYKDVDTGLCTECGEDLGISQVSFTSPTFILLWVLLALYVVSKVTAVFARDLRNSLADAVPTDPPITGVQAASRQMVR